MTNDEAVDHLAIMRAKSRREKKILLLALLALVVVAVAIGLVRNHQAAQDADEDRAREVARVTEYLIENGG